MKRRDFLRNSVLVSGGVLVAPSIFAQSSFSERKKLKK